jgi:hypothetical protein
MSPYRRLVLCVVVVGAVVALVACDIDLFGNDRRTIAGPYGLFVGETKFYLILDKWENNRPCGILEGSVTELGWNDQVILANQETCSGKPSGWMVIHLKTEVIDPPIDSAKLKRRHDLSRIQVMPVRAAWNRLKR